MVRPRHTRIAAFQLAHTEEADASLFELHRCLRWCGDNGVDLACFPECYIGGYFPNDRERAAAAAFDLSSRRWRELAETFAGYSASWVAGLTERRGAQLRNTAVVISQGSMIGAYTKAHPNEAFFAAGDAFPVFRLDRLLVGVNICNDANYPSAAASVAEQGAEVIFMPLNNRMRRSNADVWRHRHVENLQARARETGCWVVSADIVAEGDTRLSYGCTAIVTPEGRVVARVPERTVGHVVQDVVARTPPGG